MKKENEDEITLEDLESASFALDGWLDAFSDDDVWEKDVPRVRRVMERIDRVIAEMKRKRSQSLSLVKPSDVH